MPWVKIRTQAGGYWEERLKPWRKRGMLKDTRRQRKLEGAGGMVGGSVILCPSYSVSRPLLFSVSVCPISPVRCQLVTRYWENPGQQAGSEVREQGQQSPGTGGN